MARQAKVKNWTPDKNLHIIRMSPENIINQVKNKREGVYYYIDDNGIYNVTDTRKNKCNTLKFPSAEEVINYFDKLEERK